MLPGLGSSYGKLEKMVIWAYELDESDAPIQRSTDEADKFTVLVNPESHSLKQMVLRDMRQGHGTTGTQTRYLGTAPSQFQYKLLFDATGAIPESSDGLLSGVPILGALSDAISGDQEDNSVLAQIERFKHVVFDPDEESHSPRPVYIGWGKFNIEVATLLTVNFDFRLFGPDGTPLRAFADVTFVESRPNCERANSDQFNSPDVTKVHIVKRGDTLPLIASKFYNDSSLYIEIARVNNLVNFRNLEPGTRLILPSVDKSKK
jgi:hypothetical protein